jgi:hypothetical protein
MKLSAYFKGKRVKLRSPLAPDAISKSINAKSGSIFWLFGEGVTGWAAMGWVRLRYRSGYFEYNAKPVLVGRIRDDLGGSILDLRYRAPLFSYLLFLLWYGFLISFCYAAALNMRDAESVASGLIPIAFAVIFMLIPVGMNAVGTMNADSELDWLLNFLNETAETTLMPD